ncbi:MAG: MFS transporter [Cuniculiplasma sp.]
MGRFSANIETSYIFAFSTVLFSMAWFWLSFTFPLRLVSLNYNYFQIGAIGTSASIPFILISYLYRKSKKVHLNLALKLPFLVMIVGSLLLLLGNDKNSIYIGIIVFTGFFQSMWWISAEIETGLLDREGMAEKYSAAWAIPTGIFPLFSGLMLQYIGFYSVYIIVLLLSIIGFFIQPIDSMERVKRKASRRINYRLIVPMSFTGVGMGFITFVVVPIIRHSNYSYLLIGFLLTIYWVMFAIGSIYANFTHIKDQRVFSILSCLLSAFPIILIFGFNIFLLAISLAMSGFGGSMGFSKILSYVNKTESPRDGVFFYESFFSFGFITGTFLGGFLAFYVNIYLALIVFLPAILYSIYLSLWRELDPIIFVPSNPE